VLYVGNIGDEVRVLTKTIEGKSGWCRVTVVSSGITGTAPFNYLKAPGTVTPSAAAKTAAPVAIKAEGLFDFKTGKPEHLLFSKGEIITIINQDGVNWWIAKNLV
jgi:hypothetical protein